MSDKDAQTRRADALRRRIAELTGRAPAGTEAPSPDPAGGAADGRPPNWRDAVERRMRELDRPAGPKGDEGGER